jgi:hypothetical protein
MIIIEDHQTHMQSGLLTEFPHGRKMGSLIKLAGSISPVGFGSAPSCLTHSVFLFPVEDADPISALFGSTTASLGCTCPKAISNFSSVNPIAIYKILLTPEIVDALYRLYSSW